MDTLPLLLLLLLLPAFSDAFTPTDNYLIDCGSSTPTVLDDGRTFAADTSSSVSAAATTVLASSPGPAAAFSSPLYRTARVFTGPSSYSFHIKQLGRHFLRLHFSPFRHPSYNLDAAAFTVSAQGFVLLTRLADQGSGQALHEYSLNLTRDPLILSFSPSGGSPLAFINAIEVISLPTDLISDTAQTVDPVRSLQDLSFQVLETVYRVNMGGPKVTPAIDTLWRSWVPDQGFLREANLAKPVNFSGVINYMKGGATEETAPPLVYSTATRLAESSNISNAAFNVTWEFGADQGFTYLIRLHFCDFVSKSANLLYFNVFINSALAVGDLDISTHTENALATPYYADFVSRVTDGSGILRVSIGPSTLQDVKADGILNGLEIMKMNSSADGFGGLSSSVPHQSGTKSISIGIIVGSAVGALVALILVAVVLFMLLRRRDGPKRLSSKSWVPFSIYWGNSHSTGSKSSSATTFTSGPSTGHGLRFPFIALQEATKNFDESWVIGVGGFGKVYKGVLKDGTNVAVKRGNPKSQQGVNEFHTEIELLSRMRHRHLVSLIGYCDERNEMILVYEFMEKGTLKSHLYGSGLPYLSWKQRLEICIGSAKGLHYLHTGQSKAIIHRDVKSANILLDENLMAKVADFGLSKTGPELDQTHVSTAVKGSFGYLDPEYFRRQQLTEKSDVYSFGVVLLEVLCARPVIDPTLPREMVNLAEWAMKWLKKGEADKIVDPHLAGKITSDSLRKFGETAIKCLAEYGVDRPPMGDVLWNLEYSLQLQEAVPNEFELDSITRFTELTPPMQNERTHENVTIKGLDTSSGTDLSDSSSMSRVFSQLIKAEGR